MGQVVLLAILKKSTPMHTYSSTSSLRLGLRAARLEFMRLPMASLGSVDRAGSTDGVDKTELLMNGVIGLCWSAIPHVLNYSVLQEFAGCLMRRVCRLSTMSCLRTFSWRYSWAEGISPNLLPLEPAVSRCDDMPFCHSAAVLYAPLDSTATKLCSLRVTGWAHRFGRCMR